MLLSTQFELEKCVYGKKQTYILHICIPTYLSTYLSIYGKSFTWTSTVDLLFKEAFQSHLKLLFNIFFPPKLVHSSLFLSLSLSLSFSRPPFLSLSLSHTHTHTHPLSPILSPLPPYIFLSFFLSISIYLSIHLSIYLSIYLCARFYYFYHYHLSLRHNLEKFEKQVAIFTLYGSWCWQTYRLTYL